LIEVDINGGAAAAERVTGVDFAELIE